MMKSLATLLPEIRYGSKEDLLPRLSLLTKKINNLILKIQKCENAEEAEYYFALLGQIQSILAILIFTEEIEVSTALRKFVSDFERIDDPFLQNYLFQKIKNKEYNIEC